MRAHTINSTNRDAWERGAGAAGGRRGRPAADQPGAAQQPAVPRRRCCRCSPSGSACSWSTRRTASPTGATTSGRTTGASPTCSSGCRTAWPCCARRRRPTTASSPTSPSSSASGATRAQLRDLPRGRSGARACGWRSSTSRPGRPPGVAGAWLPQLPGSGIVYTLTKRDAELVATWLTAAASRRRRTAARSRPRARIDVEERLLRNELKAVVATSALGMGYDKPDLGFVVHYQAPGLGHLLLPAGRPCRARGIERAEVVLLRGAEDRASRTSSSSRRSRGARTWSGARGARTREDGATLPRADRPRQPRPRPDRGDAQGARRRGRGRAARHALGRRAGARLGLRRPSATRRSPRCAATSRRRWRRSAPTGAA